jgi:glutamyl-tRNA synthetase
MHIGNLRTALYEFLIAKHNDGKFILRIEDTDKGRYVEGSVDVIYNTLRIAGLNHDEGPDIGGNYGPYIQSERKSNYMEYAKQLINQKKAYYCFCTKERLESLSKNISDEEVVTYDRHCLNLSAEEIENNLKNNVPFIIRQFIPEGETTFNDLVFGEITVNNSELDDQVLIKSDGLPTYNFANVVDDHLMEISHVIRGSEYLSSTPKYNLLYGAFGWDVPIYMHLPLLLNENGHKLSKRLGDASFEDLLSEGFLPDAIINYIALLGWSPSDNREFFTLDELIAAFDGGGISKSPSIFDKQKLVWMNGEYIKKLSPEKFYEMALPYLKVIKDEGISLKKLSEMVKTRVNFVKEIPDLISFINTLPEYQTDLYIHKKMKTTPENSLASLRALLGLIKNIDGFSEENLHAQISALISEMGVKNAIVLWPLRTALSGQPTSPCGGIELLSLLGKEESIKRLEKGIQLLEI